MRFYQINHLQQHLHYHHGSFQVLDFVVGVDIFDFFAPVWLPGRDTQKHGETVVAEVCVHSAMFPATQFTSKSTNQDALCAPVLEVKCKQNNN